MIQIPNTTAVGWTTPPVSTQVNPVNAVQPVGATGRERQAGFGPGQDGQAPSKKAAGNRASASESADEQTVPLLPRSSASRQSNRVDRAQDVAARRQAEQRAAEEEAERAADKAMREKLQTVLTSVWQASAAVVERALGRDSANEASVGRADVGAAPGAQGLRPPLPPESPSSPEEAALPWPVLTSDADAAPAGPTPVAPEEVVAYDEKGNTSTVPPEMGGLVDQRV